MYNDPINTIYSSLSEIQQKAIRELLAERFHSALGKFLREGHTGPVAVIMGARLAEQFVEGTGDPTPVLQKLFTLAEQQNCNSILQLAAEILSNALSIADESGIEGEVEVRKFALAETTEIQKVLKHAFPDLPAAALLQEIRRDRAVIDRPSEAIRTRPGGKPRLH